MILPLLIAASVASAAPPPPAPSLADAAHAIDAGRLDQARLMVERAMAAGAKGAEIDRLLADLAFRSGNNAEALLRYRQLFLANHKDQRLCERAAIAALRILDTSGATPFVECATAGTAESWRAWNARGVLADLNRDWEGADAAFAHAAELAPKRAEVVNNQGWSRLLRGDWRQAQRYFERAAALDPKSRRIASNLELARAALASDLPQRRAGESEHDWAARLNDAGVAAKVLGDRPRAVAAFTQALEASGSWYARAANNLEAAGGKP
jgi:tetratricopeptide (TPR) repeat protein